MNRQFKIDILSSRGLSIVYDIFGNINFTDSIDYEDVNVFKCYVQVITMGHLKSINAKGIC